MKIEIKSFDDNERAFACAVVKTMKDRSGEFISILDWDELTKLIEIVGELARTNSRHPSKLILAIMLNEPISNLEMKYILFLAKKIVQVETELTSGDYYTKCGLSLVRKIELLTNANPN